MLAVAALAGSAIRGTAHELRPAIVNLTVSPTGEVDLSIDLNLEAFLLQIGAEHTTTDASGRASDYDALRAAPSATLVANFRNEAPPLLQDMSLRTNKTSVAMSLEDVIVPETGNTEVARVSRLQFTAQLPPDATALSWTGGAALGQAVLRVSTSEASEPFFASLLQPGAASEPVVLDGVIVDRASSVLADYIPVGFDHIVPKGLDHILFVIGLFLLSPHFRPLAWQVTCFTLAHSVTLALGLYGLVRISPAIVEPLIAASIIFVAIENLTTTRLSRFRSVVVFAFGLLHGLGFASVLTDFGLPEGQYLPALIGFNIGVELGQLAVLAVCFLAVGIWFRHRHWYRHVISIPASLIVALVACVWFVERVA
ncbi:HupE/UreJ family protein (plasmid) [Leisingera caerulea]|uniref:HupE/UreJ family protein n=2 Tax=Leisingera caerulea TaxID=506591 RepID=A0A9Q9HL03_LEICA|nr:HupE/UreJ family protein [Leisingera caerulea]